MPQFTQAFVQVLALADSPTVDCGLKMEVLKVSSFALNSSNLFLNVMLPLSSSTLIIIIIHQTHYEKSDWSRAFNQFTIACELDILNAISAADIAFTMSSSMSAWLLSHLECPPQKRYD